MRQTQNEPKPTAAAVQPAAFARVLQGLAWKIADQLRWPDSFMAECIALTQLRADAFVCMDAAPARALSGIVKLASIDDLLASAQPR